MAVGGAACSPSPPPTASAGPVATSSGPSAAASVAPSPSVTPHAVGTPAATSVALDRPLAGSGSIAVVHRDGSLWIIDTDGRSAMLAGTDAGSFGLPTWSPDASRIAVIRSSTTQAAIVVFEIDDATAGRPVDPLVIFETAAAIPFYLSWTPDGKDVSFLATVADGVALWIAPADGSAAVDGTAPGAMIRAGSPFYFDWIEPDRMLAHIGSGADAFLGEIDRSGVALGPTFKSPGIFRSADVSGDGKYVGFVRSGTGGQDAVVVAARDGSDEQSMPVFGVAAVDFSPTQDTLASIGSLELVDASLGFPLGPLRLIDARTGATRTLLDGSVLTFAWSPDGKTIAAIRVVPSPDASSASSASPTTSPAPPGRTEVRLAFVDVASGKILSEPVIAPGRQYVDALMTYFDQYALSHRLWAPDSASVLLPQTDPDGSTHLDVIYPNGDPPVSFEGEIGFWSP